MVLISNLHSSQSVCHSAVSLALPPSSGVGMDPQAVSDIGAGDAGTKKKSSFQITSVRKGDTASLSSEVGAIDEFDVDPEEGEGEGEGDDEEDNLSGSVNLDPSGDPVNHSENAGQAAPDVPQSQSKYRVVRIKKSREDRRFTRGRWNCYDYVDANGDQALSSPNENQNQDEEQSRKSGIIRKTSENTDESTGDTIVVNLEESKRTSNSVPGDSTSGGASRPSGSGKKVAFGPVATATIGASSNATAGEDTSSQTNNSNEPKAARNLLATVQDAVLRFSASQQQEVQTLKVEVNSLNHSVTQLRSKEKRTSSDIERLNEDKDNLAEENRRLISLMQSLVFDKSTHKSA